MTLKQMIDLFGSWFPCMRPIHVVIWSYHQLPIASFMFTPREERDSDVGIGPVSCPKSQLVLVNQSAPWIDLLNRSQFLAASGSLRLWTDRSERLKSEYMSNSILWPRVFYLQCLLSNWLTLRRQTE